MDSHISRRAGLLGTLTALACTLGFAASAHAATTYPVTAGDAASLSNAIDQANDDGDDSIVNVPAGHYNLEGSGLTILQDGSFTLVGAGARSTIIDLDTTPGSGESDSAFTIANSAATFSGITVTGASVDGFGGAFFVNSSTQTLAADRGAVGPPFLTLTDSTISGNDAESGGGVYSQGNLTLERDTFTNNQAAEDGSAVEVNTVTIDGATRGLIAGNAEIVNSTFTGNTTGSTDDGYGTLFFYSAIGDLVNDTIAGNHDNNGEGNAGITAFAAQVTVTNTILANNTVGAGESAFVGNCDTGKGLIESDGHNIESGEDCNFTADGDHQDTDPLLGPLQNNGGQMDTMALLAGSPAIDNADATACPPTDEIGTLRPQGPGCDIGAYEVPLTPPAPPAPPATTPAAPTPPAPAPAPPAKPAAPTVGVAGVRRACVSRSFHLRFHIATKASVKKVTVKLDGRTIRSTTRGTFTLRINTRKLKAGRHHVTITAVDSAGQTTRAHRTFSVCKAVKPHHHAAPRFTG